MTNGAETLSVRVLVSAAVILLAVGCGGGGGGGTASKGSESFGSGLSAAQVATRLKAAGFPIGKVEVYNASTDPNGLLGRPGLYTSKVNFIDTRVDQSGYQGEEHIDTGQGGSVEVFASDGDAKKRADFVRSITRGSSVFAEYSYLRDRVFLRLSKELTPGQAKRYEQALRELK